MRLKLEILGKSLKTPCGAGLFFGAMIAFMEAVLRINTTGHGWSAALWFALCFGAPVAALLLVVSRSRSAAVRGIFGILFNLLLYFYFASQLIYFHIFRTFYSTYSVLRAGQGLAFADVILGAMVQLWLPLLLLALPAALQVIFRASLYRFAPVSRPRVLFLAALIYLSGVASLGLTGDSPNQAKAQYFGRVIPSDAVDSIGLLSYTLTDLLSHVRETPAPGMMTWLDDEDVTPVPTESLPPETLPALSPEAERRPQVLDIDFDALIANETDPVLRDLHGYFRRKRAGDTNAYTGKFKDYNLILITAEGFSHLAVRPDLTPTLYQMRNEGFRFRKFYVPIWGVSTSDGEYVALLSRIPKPGVWSMAISGSTSLPFALGNQFRRLGYTTKAYHNHYYEYYGRDESHPNLGYDYKGLGSGLRVTEVWPESDLEMMELTAPEYMDEPRFHAYYMTVSGHLQYNFWGNFISKKNREFVEHLEMSEPAKAYLACQIELDRAVKHLLDQLRERGIADRTVIAITADHYPYGLPYDAIDELSGHEVDRRLELYENAWILYVDGMEAIETDQVASSFDLLPTLSNLFDLPYDSRFFMGRDIFSDSPVLIPFVDRSWLSQEGFFDSETQRFLPIDSDAALSPEAIEKKRAEVEAMFYVSEKLLDRDYFKRLEQYWEPGGSTSDNEKMTAP